METGFVIVNYNDFETTAKLLENIKNYEIIDQIVVVDNCSSDDSFSKLVESYSLDHIAIIRNNHNGGYASGINLGCRFLIDKIENCNIVISNADIVIYEERDLASLLQSKTKECAIIAPIIKEHDGLNCGWKIPSPFVDSMLNIVFIQRFLRTKLILYKNEYYNQKIVDVEAVSGCFFVIDSTTLKEVDFFDENTFLYYEENIMGKKIAKINKRISINTEVEVFHNHSVSIDKSIDHMNKYKQLKKSQYYFQTRYNNAGFLTRLLLKVTEKTSYFILSILK